MFIHKNEYNYPSLEVVEIPKVGRFYQSPTNELWYPSITTITGHKKASFFKEWRKKPGNDKILTNAATRGTALHNITEKYINNDREFLKNRNEVETNLFNTIQPELDKINNIVLQEQSIWSDTIRVAGRVDCIAEYNGKLSIIDFKTSLKPKKKDWITNYFEQATGYSIMFEERTGKFISNIVIIISSEDGTLQVFEEDNRKYVKSLKESLDQYWLTYSFDRIQNLVNTKLKKNANKTNVSKEI